MLCQIYDKTRLVIVPFVGTKLAEGVFSYAGPTAWNDMQQVLRERGSLTCLLLSLL
jgi:hypothetical protein